MNESIDRQILTHSRMLCARTCLHKHYLRYELALRPDQDSYPLRFGTAYHRLLEAEDRREGIPDPLMEDPFDNAAVRVLCAMHAAQYRHEPLEVVATELPFEIPLVNPESGRPTPNWMLAGKIDRIVRLGDGRLAIEEYKTSSDDISPGSDYWIRLRMDQQISLYLLAARELGHDVQTILYDVSKRPALRQLKATPRESRKYTKTGELYASQREDDETLQAFTARLAEHILENPQGYFIRVEIPRLEEDLAEFREEVWQQQLWIRSAQKSGHWFRNTAACSGFGLCEYFHICGNRDLETTVPAGFRRVTDLHPELSADASPR